VITHLKEFREFVRDLDSGDRYVKFLKDIETATGMDISPASL
jgi:hypothetical protein